MSVRTDSEAPWDGPVSHHQDDLELSVDAGDLFHSLDFLRCNKVLNASQGVLRLGPSPVINTSNEFFIPNEKK